MQQKEKGNCWFQCCWTKFLLEWPSLAKQVTGHLGVGGWEEDLCDTWTGHLGVGRKRVNGDGRAKGGNDRGQCDRGLRMLGPKDAPQKRMARGRKIDV